jgi:hypothetical protein
MSYSIGAKSATKEALKTAITDELAKVPASQPVHETDINQAINAAVSLIDLMKDDPARDIRCSVSGSIWQKDDAIQQVSLNVQVNLVDREEAKTA